MDRKEVVSALIEILTQVQTDAGEEVQEVTEKTCPIGGIGFFDSLTGVAVTLICKDRFGIDDDGKSESLFHGKNKKGFCCAFSVGEIADRIVALTAEE